MGKLLKLKHWQIFLLVVGIPLLVQLVQNIFIVIGGWQRQGPFFALSGILLGFSLLIYYLWLGEVGRKFSEDQLPGSMNAGSFRLSFWISCISSVFLFIYFWYYDYTISRFPEGGVIPITLIGIIVFVALFSLFYCLSFVAKAIVQRERNHKITSAEYFSEFIMAVTFPIGIWFLQPRINRLAEGKG